MQSGGHYRSFMNHQCVENDRGNKFHSGRFSSRFCGVLWLPSFDTLLPPLSRVTDVTHAWWIYRTETRTEPTYRVIIAETALPPNTARTVARATNTAGCPDLFYVT